MENATHLCLSCVCVCVCLCSLSLSLFLSAITRTMITRVVVTVLNLSRRSRRYIVGCDHVKHFISRDSSCDGEIKSEMVSLKRLGAACAEVICTTARELRGAERRIGKKTS